MKVVFISFISSSNIGDRLIVKSLRDNLFTNEEISSYNFNFLKDLDQQIEIAEEKNFLFKIIEKYRKFFLLDYIISAYSKFAVQRNFKKSDIIEKIKESDMVVLGGGNTIFDLTRFSNSSLKIKLIIETAKKYNKKVFVTSIGLGPFVTEKQLRNSIEVLNKADYITVRDKKSFNYFNKTDGKIYLSIDPVFSFKGLEKFKKTKKISESQKVIGINIMDLSLNKNSLKDIYGYKDSMMKLVNSIIEHTHNQVILYTTEPRDNIVLEDIYMEYYKNEQVSKADIVTSNDLIKLYSKLDLIIGTRMHSMIVGVAMNIPVIGISWQSKVNAMFELVGLKEYCIELNKFIEDSTVILNLVNNMDMNNVHDKLKLINTNTKKQFEINIELYEDLKNKVNID